MHKQSRFWYLLPQL